MRPEAGIYKAITLEDSGESRLPDDRTFKVHYRQVAFECNIEREDPLPDFESMLREALEGPHGADYEQRLLAIEEGSDSQVLLNEHEVRPPGVFVELYHVDGRRSLRFLRRTDGNKRTASVFSRAVPRDEEALGQYGFVLAQGNHLATIETSLLRTGALQSFFNLLLSNSGQLPVGVNLKLVPRVQLGRETAWAEKGVSRLEIIPTARLMGDAPSAVEHQPRSKGRRAERIAEDRGAQGSRILDIFKILGSSEAELETIRTALSSDLGLEAKVQIVVRKNIRATEAILRTEDLSQAVESLEQYNKVSIVSPDGRRRNNLTTLWDTAEVAEVDGEIPLANVLQALQAVMLRWAARGLIDLGA